MTLESSCSGTGQHAAHFAENQPSWKIQTSEYEDSKFPSIEAYARDHENVLNPVELDLRKGSGTSSPWGYNPGEFDVVYCANLTHIAPWEATVGLIEGSSRILRSKRKLIIYGKFKRNRNIPLSVVYLTWLWVSFFGTLITGPFKKNGKFRTENDPKFDESLKKDDPSWVSSTVRVLLACVLFLYSLLTSLQGLRDVEDVTALANANSFDLNGEHEMPKMNLTLVFQKR